MNRVLAKLSLLGIGLAATAVAAVEANASKIVDPAATWDHLWHEVLFDLFIIGSIFMVLGFYWLIRYRAVTPNAVGSGPVFDRTQAIAWALIPAVLFMADDFFLAAKGWTAWNIYRDVPKNAMEIKLTGSMWNWQFQYENGVTTSFDVDSKEGEGLVVPQGKPVVLRMTSTDVIHSFFLPDYRVKEDLMPGRVTYLWFYPKDVKESVATCTEFCGNRHSFMYSKVKVLAPKDYDAWMAKQKKPGA